MGASQCLDHLSRLKIFHADGAGVLARSVFFALLLLFILETWNSVDDVLYFLWRLQWLAIFVDLRLFLPVLITVLKLLVVVVLALRHVVELLPLAVRRVLVLLLLPVGPLVASCLEHIAVKVYLDPWILVLDLVQHVVHVAHDALNVEEIGVLLLLSLLVAAVAT